MVSKVTLKRPHGIIINGRILREAKGLFVWMVQYCQPIVFLFIKLGRFYVRSKVSSKPVPDCSPYITIIWEDFT